MNWKVRVVAGIDRVFAYSWSAAIVCLFLLSWEVKAYEYIHPDKPTIQNDEIRVVSDGTCPMWVIDNVMDSFGEYPGAPKVLEELRRYDRELGMPINSDGIHTVLDTDYVPLFLDCVEDLDTTSIQRLSVDSRIKSVVMRLMSATGKATAAQTGIRWYSHNRAIVDIEMTFAMKYTDKESIRLFSLHENGHALGLGHSKLKQAAMYFQYTGLNNLHADDLGGYSVLYGLCDTAKVDAYRNVWIPKATAGIVEGEYQVIIERRGKVVEVQE